MTNLTENQVEDLGEKWRLVKRIGAGNPLVKGGCLIVKNKVSGIHHLWWIPMPTPEASEDGRAGHLHWHIFQVPLTRETRPDDSWWASKLETVGAICGHDSAQLRLWAQSRSVFDRLKFYNALIITHELHDERLRAVVVSLRKAPLLKLLDKLEKSKPRGWKRMYDHFEARWASK